MIPTSEQKIIVFIFIKCTFYVNCSYLINYISWRVGHVLPGYLSQIYLPVWRKTFTAVTSSDRSPALPN
jgi:hypothetical protein